MFDSKGVVSIHEFSSRHDVSSRIVLRLISVLLLKMFIRSKMLSTKICGLRHQGQLKSRAKNDSNMRFIFENCDRIRRDM
jgi:hypothetical protein